MRSLVLSGLICLFVLPAAALETKLPESKIARTSSGDEDTTRNATMDSVGPSNLESDLAAGSLNANAEPSPAEADIPAKPVVYRPMDEVCEAVTQAARSNNLPVGFFIRLLHQESGFKPDVVSHAGAQGVAQFMPAVAVSMGVENPFDPLQAIPASARLLRDLFQKFGNLGLAAAAYNAGPKRIQTWLTTRKAALPKETVGYVRSITGKPIENWKAVSKTVPDSRPLLRQAPCKPPDGEVMQVAEREPPKPAHTKLLLVVNKVSNALKKVAEVKTRMASTARPAVAALKVRTETAPAKAGKIQDKPISLAAVAKRTKPNPVKLAMAEPKRK